MRGVVLVFLLRTTPQECVIRKGKLKETFVTVMGEISVRPIFHGFIRSGPDGEDDDGEGNDGACDDAGHGDAGDGDDHATAATGAAGGAPCGATKRVWGVPKLRGCAMRPRPLGPLVELPMGPRNTWRCADMSSWWRATASTWAICGAPYGATKRVSDAPT